MYPSWDFCLLHVHMSSERLALCRPVMPDQWPFPQVRVSRERVRDLAPCGRMYPSRGLSQCKHIYPAWGLRRFVWCPQLSNPLHAYSIDALGVPPPPRHPVTETRLEPRRPPGDEFHTLEGDEQPASKRTGGPAVVGPSGQPRVHISRVCINFLKQVAIQTSKR